MNRKLLKKAMQLAIREHSKHPEWHYYMHWTMVVQDDRMVEWATNKGGTPPSWSNYHPMSKLHSEFLAYKRAKGLLGRGDFEIINIRLNRQLKPRISAPCPTCAGWLQLVGCTKCWFTTPSGWASLTWRIK